MTEILLALLMGALVGSVLGLFGSGGSTLAVPLLVYGLGISPKHAIPMSLIIVGSTAVYGFLINLRNKLVSIKTGLFFGGGGVLGAFFGARLSQFFTGEEQLLIFAVILLLAASSMLYKALSNKEIQEVEKINCPLMIIIGFGVGILTGLIGVGGGFLIVPVLTFSGLNIRIAIGTSLMIIAFNALSGVIGYINIANFHWPLTLTFVLSSLLATRIASHFVQKIPVKAMKISFAIFLIVMGVFLVLKNINT